MVVHRRMATVRGSIREALIRIAATGVHDDKTHNSFAFADSQ